MFDFINWYYTGLMFAFTIVMYILYIMTISKEDPLYHCPRYKKHGCSHIDGMFCELKTCNIKDITHE